MTAPVPKTTRRGKPDLEAARKQIARGMPSEGDIARQSWLPVTAIEHGNNPRLESDATKNAELAESIRQHGILQPIRVRPVADGKYQIIAGHRRYEAAKVAGLAEIPIVVTNADEQTAYVESLVENLQREDLDPIDEAKAYRALIDTTKLTQKELGSRIGRSQSQISNSLALLGLQPEIQKQLQAGNLSVGHAKVLAYMPKEKQTQLAKDAVERKLTVRDVEAIASRQKADELAEKERVEKAVKTASAIIDFLEKNVAKDALLVLYSQQAADAAVAAGWANARPVAWKTDTTYPTYTCECEALWVQQGQEFTTRRICVDKAHERSAKAKAAAAARGKEKEAENTLDRARRAAQAALRIGPAQMSEDAIRLGLYALLMREELYGGNADRTRSAFVKRTGGDWPEFPSGGEGAFAIWEAVVGLNTSDLVTEYLAMAVAFVIPNVYTQSAYANREHAAVRQWLVDQFDVDASIVWGGKDSNGWDKLQPKDLGATKAKAKAAPVQEATEPEPVVDVEVPDDDAPPEPGPVTSMEDALREAGLDKPLDAPEVVLPGVTVISPEGTELGDLMSDDSIRLMDPGDPNVLGPDPERGLDGEDLEQYLADDPSVRRLPLDGERVCVTGVVEGMDRNAVSNAVVKAGGYFDEKVNGLTTLLVIGEKPGASKVAAATKFGTKTMTESEFRARLRGE